MASHVPPIRLLKEYRKLALRKFRKKSSKMILEGIQLVKEALQAGVKLESLIYTPEFAAKPESGALLAKAGGCGGRIFQMDAAAFAAIAQTETPQGVAAIAPIPEKKVILCRDEDLFLVLDRIQDPGNLGTIIRTAAAAGIGGIILLQGTADPYSPKALRASMGGIFYIPIILEAEMPDWSVFLKEQGVQLVAADPRGELPYYRVDFQRPSAVIIGNESQGVGKDLLEKAETKAYIPLKGKFDTLNAAIAAAAFILESQRQKNFH